MRPCVQNTYATKKKREREKKMKTWVHTKTCTWLFITALFKIAKKWEHPKHSSTGEWVSNMYYIHTVENYLAVVLYNMCGLWKHAKYKRLHV